MTDIKRLSPEEAEQLQAEIDGLNGQAEYEAKEEAEAEAQWQEQQDMDAQQEENYPPEEGF